MRSATGYADQVNSEPRQPDGASRRRRMAVFGLLFSLLVGLSYGGLALSRSRSVQCFGGLVRRVDTKARLLALTFDDGPEPGATEALLAVLQRHQARATFFLIGAEIERHPELARSIARAGHQLGNHSFHHQRLIFKRPSYIRHEVDATSRAIRAVGYEGPIAFRPPYGKKLFYLPYYLKTQHIRTILWDVEPDSYADIADRPERIVAHVLARVQSGSIVLLHAMNRAPALAAVEPILTTLSQRGYRFVTVDELLRAGAGGAEVEEPGPR